MYELPAVNLTHMSMVSCPNCHFAYSAGLSRCPGCDEYETPSEARKSHLSERVETQFDAGVSRETVRRSLLQEGFSELEADTLTSNGARQVARVVRSNAIARTLKGIAMTAFGLFWLLASWFAGRLLLAFTGATVLLLGLLAITTGVIGMITGRHPD